MKTPSGSAESISTKKLEPFIFVQDITILKSDDLSQEILLQVAIMIH